MYKRQTLKGALSQYTDASLRGDDFEKVAEAQSQQQLTPFFAQWIDGTGAPQFKNKYSVYRLGNNKGFRTIGEVNQDLDLFRMPVELRVETDGKTETQKIDVVAVSYTHLKTPVKGLPPSTRVSLHTYFFMASGPGTQGPPVSLQPGDPAIASSSPN